MVTSADHVDAEYEGLVVQVDVWEGKGECAVRLEDKVITKEKCILF